MLCHLIPVNRASLISRRVKRSRAIAVEQPSLSPSPNLLRLLSQQFKRHPPFDAMDNGHLEQLLRSASEVYYAPGETVCAPQNGVPRHLNLIRQGEVSARRGEAALDTSGRHFEAGDFFPLAAVLGRRATSSTYQAASDLFCLQIPLETLEEVARHSPPLADFLAGQTMHLLELSRRALQSSQASQALQEQSLERPLGEIRRGPPVTCSSQTSIKEVLQIMSERRIGSMLVVDAQQRLLGIFTRQDALDRVALAETPLNQAIAGVMTRNVHTLTVEHHVEDAALLMSRHGCTHVPLLEAGRLVGIVSERDLFAMQRLSLKRVSSELRDAISVAELIEAAASIRNLARWLVSQGMQAKSLTELISHLNNLLTQRLLQIIAKQLGIDLNAMCWLSFGSEGRSEQTIATDQDNGLIFQSTQPEQDRPSWLAFADQVCRALDRCGYPLCKGNIMASNPACCLTLEEWRQRFSRWIEHGSPEDLLKASIFFDLRPLAGRMDWGQSLQQHIASRAQPLPRFQKMLAAELLQRQVPLTWLGGIETQNVEGRRLVDLKLHGTAIFVDVARLQSLALGSTETNTRRRFEAVARSRGDDPRQVQAWCYAFEYLQMLRLQAQLEPDARPPALERLPNAVEPELLNDIDRRLLKESLRIARELQQRVQMDYGL